MRVLVLGGTGAMGVHLCKLLADKGDNVYVTSRSKRDNDVITYLRGDAHDLGFLNPVLKMEMWDVIIDFMNYTTDEFVTRVDSLLSSCAQYVFLSSSRVYAPSEKPLTEESARLLDVCHDHAFLSTDDYSLAKARQENVLFENKKKNWTIIRPYITYSEYRLQLTSLEKEDWLYRSLNGRTIILSEEFLSKSTTLTYGYDVALAMSKLLGSNETIGQVYHITNPCEITWRAVFDIYNNAYEEFLGRPIKYVTTPRWEYYQGGDYAQVEYDRKFDRKFNTDKITKYISKEEFKDTEVGLKHCLISFLQKQEWGFINWANEARKDSFTHEWAGFSEIPSLKRKARYIINRIEGI